MKTKGRREILGSTTILKTKGDFYLLGLGLKGSFSVSAVGEQVIFLKYPLLERDKFHPDSNLK